MAKRNYKPLPQTIREQPGTRWKVMRRVAAFVCSNAREDTETKGWVRVYQGDNLTRADAELILSRCRNHVTLKGCFEYAIIPHEQLIP